jgi:hypothetical protein
MSLLLFEIVLVGQLIYSKLEGYRSGYIHFTICDPDNLCLLSRAIEDDDATDKVWPEL